MTLRPVVAIAAGALAALAAWPFLQHPGGATASLVAPAAVNRDYLHRDLTIAFEETQVRRNPGDQITRRMLASQYLQRFREQGDVGDVARAQNMAVQSIRLQPQGNTAAQMALASALLGYHDFPAALAHEQDAIAGEPFNDSARAQKASILMEIGRYAEAHRVLELRSSQNENPTWDSVAARYDEEAGRLAGARALIRRAARFADGLPYLSAYDRSWYHMRAGQLAFQAGGMRAADREYRAALSLFPDNSMALMWQARLYRAERHWQQALQSATRSADIYPLPQALGYKADAQRALGQPEAARSTDALIRAEQRLFNVQGINDRLLAVYCDQRGVFLDDALAAARDDYRRRGDEIYADDTLAWALAALHRWSEARVYSLRATRLHTQDPTLQFHAGVIAIHSGHLAEGLARLHAALRENAQFDPFDAPVARKLLAQYASPAKNVKKSEKGCNPKCDPHRQK
ncbi:MAG TPA: hypothetical protein VGZ02_05345 [Candidatus Baltobacteraceae bacterium]|nr:hypothetical protein [Candidatus Baltobacteraceae bacterium]